MLSTHLLKTMSRCAARTTSDRTRAFSRHLMSTSASPPEPTVLFESNGSVRKYILNRPAKLNALDDTMLSLLKPKIEEWSESDLSGIIVGSAVGRAFCIGGDVANIANNAKDPATRHEAIEFFKREFELDYILAALTKPYVAILDGHTMGGGVGLSAPAPFRIATEKTVFAMPETKIGYFPDVGASYFLSRLDGEIGTYLSLTSDTLHGRAVFEHGFATHFIPSRRIPMLVDRLAALDKPTLATVDRTIEELSLEREPSESPAPLIGPIRMALDFAFRHDNLEAIYRDLEAFKKDENPEISQWASTTLALLDMRSPTGMKVALKAIRNGKSMSYADALDMELKIATAFCNQATPDFITGVKAVLTDKTKERPQWSPDNITEVSDDIISRFFDNTSPYLSKAPSLAIPKYLTSARVGNLMRFALPTEEEIGAAVVGAKTSPGSASSALRLDELVSRFVDQRGGKMGVKEKVLEVANRRCKVEDNADGNAVWLTWKHAPQRP